MSTSQISRRYACALFELIQEGVKIEDDLAKLAAVADHEAVSPILTSPDYSAEMKAGILTKAAGSSLCAEVDRLVRILADRNKTCLLPEIHAQVASMIHDAASKLDAEVTVATSISKAMQDKLSKALAASTGKKISLSVNKDASILGGMVVRIGDRKIDYSLRTKLGGLRRALAS